MDTPIINPWVIYICESMDGLFFSIIIFTIVFTIPKFCFIAETQTKLEREMDDLKSTCYKSEEQIAKDRAELEKIKKKSSELDAEIVPTFIKAAISIFVAVALIPSTRTAYKMLLASCATPENIDNTIKLLGEAVKQICR